MQLNNNQGVYATQRPNQPKPVELIELFYERIYAFLRRLTGNDEDAADLTQLTFSRVWQKLPTFAGRSSPGSWIHSIAYHLYVDWRRSDGHTEVRSDDWWAARPATESEPDEIVAREDLQATVYASVDALASRPARYHSPALLSRSHSAGNGGRHGCSPQHHQIPEAPGPRRIAQKAIRR